MMNKKILSILTASVLTFGLAGCSGNSSSGSEIKKAKTWEYGEPTTLVYDCLGGDGNVMPVLGFWSAPSEAMLDGQYFPNMKNDEYFTAVKEAGVNMLLQTNDVASYNDAEVEKTLDFCDKYDMGYYVTDYRHFGVGTAGAALSNEEKLKEAFAEYSKHKSFAGFYICDEPRPMGVEASVNYSLRSFYGAADELGLNIHPYLNLNPYNASFYKPDPSINYKKHIDDIYKGIKNTYIMYDIYPLLNSGFSYEMFYGNISLVRQGAIDNGIVWIPFVGTCAGNNTVLPDEGELAWQVNVYLAFGAKGISYFPINSPLSFSSAAANGNTVAMFDYYGNKTEVYYYAKEADKQIAAVQAYLMKATNHGVIMNGDLKGSQYLTNNELIESGSFRELKSVEGDAATVGCFDYYGKSFFYAVNGSMKDVASVTLDFDARYSYEVIQRGEKVTVKGSKVVLDLAAGEAALVKLI